MQQGYLRHIGFWPDASCLVLCSALRCAALLSRSALLGLDFPTRPSSAPVLNHLTFQVCLFLLVLLLCSALPVVDPLGSSLQSSLSHGCRLARAANLLRSVPASLELDLDATSSYHKARLRFLTPLHSTIAFVLTIPAKLQSGHFPPSTFYPSSSRHTRLPPVFHWRG